MTLIEQLKRPVSIASLMKMYEDRFYQYQTSDEPKLDLPTIYETRLVDLACMEAYGIAVNDNRIAIARPGNVTENLIISEPPPLLECLAWWLNETIEHDGHGWTAHMTPSSTFHAGRRLGVSFVRYEWLRVGFTITKKFIMSPQTH